MTTISTFRFHIKLVDDLFIKQFSGRIVHGAFLQFLKEFDKELSTYLHESKGRQPYSLTKFQFRKMGNQWIAYFDLNTIDDQIISTLVRLLVTQEEYQFFIIDRFCPVFKVEYQKSVIPDPKSLPNDTRLWLNFETPTVFANSKRNSNTDPFPHISTIWKQMISNYSRLIDEISDIDTKLLIKLILDQLSTPKFKLRSKHLTLGHKIKITGFQGSILFMIEDNSHLELIYPILKLAEVWGIGGKTTMGFGRMNINIYQPESKEPSKRRKLETTMENTSNE